MVVTCKGCGKAFTWTHGTGRATWTPNCDCKQKRNRVREAGCPHCNEHGLIQLTKTDDIIIADCPDCGWSWIVNGDD